MQKTENEYRDKTVIEKMGLIKNKIAVMSNKGGVGKSTIAANIASSFAKKGFKVGIFDADLHGPSLLKLFGLEGKKMFSMENQILPLEAENGVQVFSVAGLMEDDKSALIWRGPLKMKFIKDFILQVDWGELDYLIIDLPPGTGDESLSICQLIPDLEGAVLVTTPQEMSLLDVKKSITFLEKLNIPVIGMLENMSGLKCPKCNEVIPFLGKGGGKKVANEFEILFLGELIFDPEAALLSDHGKGFFGEMFDVQIGEQFAEVIKNIEEYLEVKR
ncbi:Mrp/NBP35 family ATP-binding protein [bacterium]